MGYESFSILIIFLCYGTLDSQPAEGGHARQNYRATTTNRTPQQTDARDLPAAQPAAQYQGLSAKPD